MRLRIPDDKGKVSKAYEWFLGLPVPIVLFSLWLAGVVLISLSVLALYYLLWLLLQVAGGA